MADSVASWVDEESKKRDSEWTRERSEEKKKKKESSSESKNSSAMKHLAKRLKAIYEDEGLDYGDVDDDEEAIVDRFSTATKLRKKRVAETIFIGSDKGERFMSCERRFAETDKFVRFTNNAFYELTEKKAIELGVSVDLVHQIMAFSHWTYKVTKGFLMMPDALTISTLLEDLVKQGHKVQKELRCNICFSIPQQPCLTTCNHLICKPCFDGWMKEGKGPKHCPVCKFVIDTRRNAEVDYLKSWTNKYLQFAKTFMKEVATYAHTFEDPFMESQVVFTQMPTRTPDRLKEIPIHSLEQLMQPLTPLEIFDDDDDVLPPSPEVLPPARKRKRKTSGRKEKTISPYSTTPVKPSTPLKSRQQRDCFPTEDTRVVQDSTQTNLKQVSRETQTLETSNTTIDLNGLLADAPITLRSIFTNVTGLEEALKKNIDELKSWVKENRNDDEEMVEAADLQHIENVSKPVVFFCGLSDFDEEDLCSEFCFAFHKEVEITRSLTNAQCLVVMGKREYAEHSLAYRTATTKGMRIIDGRWVRDSLRCQKLCDMMDYAFKNE
ncbi:unnamed protein product, partial [Mesorhabditis belari]|uniref:RING-type E3 ubiquitin transferase n=1 Tax=Mesorhabditis belari TaxID=2138241 RepID=A0AAF3F922_9BILA